MELKDFFAAHVAAALAHRVERPDAIATRAYELAEAMLRERARRAPAEEDPLAAPDLIEDLDGMPDDEFFRGHGGFSQHGLLDEPAPFSEREGMELDPAWLDRDANPLWEVDPKWGPAVDRSSMPERPGLARTAPITIEDDKKRRPA